MPRDWCRPRAACCCSTSGCRYGGPASHWKEGGTSTARACRGRDVGHHRSRRARWRSTGCRVRPEARPACRPGGRRSGPRVERGPATATAAAQVQRGRIRARGGRGAQPWGARRSDVVERRRSGASAGCGRTCDGASEDCRDAGSLAGGPALERRPPGLDFGHGAAQPTIKLFEARARSEHHLLQSCKLVHPIVRALVVEELRRTVELVVHALRSSSSAHQPF